MGSHNVDSAECRGLIKSTHHRTSTLLGLMAICLITSFLGVETAIADPVSGGPEGDGSGGGYATPTPTPTPTPTRPARIVDCNGDPAQPRYDVNEDRIVDSSDLAALDAFISTNGSRTDVDSSNANYNVNGDAYIDFRDRDRLDAFLIEKNCKNTKEEDKCRVTKLSFSHPCRQRDRNGRCTAYSYLGTHGGAGHAPVDIVMRTDGEVNQNLSCLYSLFNDSFRYTNSWMAAGLRPISAADFKDDNLYHWQAWYSDSTKNAPKAVMRYLWASLLEVSDLAPPFPEYPRGGTPAQIAAYQAELDRYLQVRADIYSTMRKNYFDCEFWGEERPNGNREWKHQGAWDGFGGGLLGEATRNQWACIEGSVLLDGNCKLQNISNLERQCGASLEIRSGMDVEWDSHTPISLIFDESANPMKNFSLVEFSFAPGKPREFSEWRGSDAAPLLVYDPQHSGQVTSVQQLFGDWTFGGKRVASLQASAPSAWENGFEALSQLDSDGDGKVSGSELEPLALWFDSNKDAITQRGEVRTIAETGVTALYYKVDKKDPLTGDFIATVGFDRTVNGKATSGRAVDWIARGRPSAAGAIMSRILENRAHSAATALENSKKPETDESIFSVTAKSTAISAALPGVWRVYLTTDGHKTMKEDGSVGFLSFQGVEDGKVLGKSLLEMTYNGGSSGTNHLVRFSALEGQIDGGGKLTFTNTRKEKTLHSTATLEDNVLWGTTTLTKNGENVTYSWVASREFTYPADANALNWKRTK